MPHITKPVFRFDSLGISVESWCFVLRGFVCYPKMLVSRRGKESWCIQERVGAYIKYVCIQIWIY